MAPRVLPPPDGRREELVQGRSRSRSRRRGRRRFRHCLRAPPRLLPRRPRKRRPERRRRSASRRRRRRRRRCRRSERCRLWHFHALPRLALSLLVLFGSDSSPQGSTQERRCLPARIQSKPTRGSACACGAKDWGFARSLSSKREMIFFSLSLSLASSLEPLHFFLSPFRQRRLSEQKESPLSLSLSPAPRFSLSLSLFPYFSLSSTPRRVKAALRLSAGSRVLSEALAGGCKREEETEKKQEGAFRILKDLFLLIFQECKTPTTRRRRLTPPRASLAAPRASTGSTGSLGALECGRDARVVPPWLFFISTVDWPFFPSLFLFLTCAPPFSSPSHSPNSSPGTSLSAVLGLLGTASSPRRPTRQLCPQVRTAKLSLVVVFFPFLLLRFPSLLHSLPPSLRLVASLIDSDTLDRGSSIRRSARDIEETKRTSARRADRGTKKGNAAISSSSFRLSAFFVEGKKKKLLSFFLLLSPFSAFSSSSK